MQSSHSHADQSSLTSLTCLAATLPVSCPGSLARLLLLLLWSWISLSCFPKSRWGNLNILDCSCRQQPSLCCGDPSWAWQPLKHKPAAGGAMLSSQRQQRRTIPPSSAAVQDETYWRGSWIYDFSQINYWVKHLHRKAGKKRELDSLQGTDLLGHLISLHSDFVCYCLFWQKWI